MEELQDKILDFIEDHRITVIIFAVAIVLLIMAVIIRGCNASQDAKELAEKQALQAQQEIEEAERLKAEEEARLAAEEEEPVSQYQINLGLNAESDGRVEVGEEPTPEPTPTPVVEKKPTYSTAVRIFDQTGVPKVNVDGSSCYDYLNKVTLADFGTFWGSELTEDDFNSKEKYLVGVEQDPNDFERGDLQSIGWVFDNFDSLSDNAAIKFTNLHVIGSLSSTHTAVLCSYDWYSAFGLKDTLVVFEDMSETLDMTEFEDGVIFSATVFKHNCKIVENIAGQRVLCVQYNIFK